MSGPSAQWETISSNRVYDGIQFDVYLDELSAPDGDTVEMDYVTDLDSVILLPITAEEKVVTIKEWRHPINETVLTLPGGKVEKDDTSPATAARRELREETGYDAESVEHLASTKPMSGVVRGTDHYFLGVNCTRAHEQTLEIDESIEIAHHSIKELQSVSASEISMDARIPISLFYYQDYDPTVGDQSDEP